jgi:myo-inositol-1(or 4)-monophosphatase
MFLASTPTSRLEHSAPTALTATVWGRLPWNGPGAGLVTDLDLELERSFRPYLTELVPGSTMMGEEEGGQRSEWTWWLDPLDGTTNFVHGWPRSAISIALYRNDEAHLGVIHDPYLKETFWAQRGEGSWCGSLRLQVSACHQLQKALIATGFAPDPPEQWEICRQLQTNCHGMRVSGCAALDLAYVACGRVDAFWEVDLQPWDVAAGMLLVREAGGGGQRFGWTNGQTGLRELLGYFGSFAAGSAVGFAASGLIPAGKKASGFVLIPPSRICRWSATTPPVQ